jgi:hypothetical protein
MSGRIASWREASRIAQGKLSAALGKAKKYALRPAGALRNTASAGPLIRGNPERSEGKLKDLLLAILPLKHFH